MTLLERRCDTCSSRWQATQRAAVWHPRCPFCGALAEADLSADDAHHGLEDLWQHPRASTIAETVVHAAYRAATESRDPGRTDLQHAVIDVAHATGCRPLREALLNLAAGAIAWASELPRDVKAYEQDAIASPAWGDA